MEGFPGTISVKSSMEVRGWIMEEEEEESAMI